MKHRIAQGLTLVLLMGTATVVSAARQSDSTASLPEPTTTTIAPMTTQPAPTTTSTLPAPITPKPTKTAPKTLPCPQWHDALREHGLPVKVFAPIMLRESKCEPRAIGWNYYPGKSHNDCKLSHARTYRNCKAVKSYDVGLLQINSSWKSLTAQVCNYEYGKMLVLQKPDCNLKVAAVIYDNGKGLANWQGTSG